MKKLLVSIILISSLFVNAQVELQVDTTYIRIGEQIQYVLSTDAKAKVQFPKLQVDSLGKIEVVYSLPADTLRNRLYKKYVLTGFDSGMYHIPKQLVLINNKQFYTDSLLINVGTIAIDTTKQKLFPIKSIYKAPSKTWRDYTNYLWWIVGVLLLLVMIWWFAFKNRKSRKQKSKKLLSPIEAALDQFQTLDSKQLLKDEKIKQYYIELTEIVRDYIGKDVHIPTMEVTTDELITLLELHNKSNKIGIDKERIKQLHQFLQEADLVKFAKLKPEQSKIQEDRKTAELIINEIQTQVHKPVLDEFGVPIIVETQEEITRKADKKRRTIGLLVAAGILLLAFAITTWYYGIQYVKDTIIGHQTKELLEGEWYHSSYGFPSVSLETPKVLKAQNIELPPQAQQAITAMAVFEYGSMIGGFYFSVNTTEYVPEAELDIDKGVVRAAEMASNQPGVSNLEYEVEDIELAGQEAKLIKGTFDSKGVKMNYSQYMIMGDHSLQQIIIAKRIDDTYANEIQERIIKSIQLQTLPKEEDSEE
ncbi:MAG TPA: hypothetical protein EYG92_04870 [Lutibacter sp.]|nr:hypothetical protein [Lutibacter sp.]